MPVDIEVRLLRGNPACSQAEGRTELFLHRTDPGVSPPFMPSKRSTILLESDKKLQDLWVQGEVSNFSRPSSGHLYFTLKDNSAVLRCVMWRTAAIKQAYMPRDGDAIEVGDHRQRRCERDDAIPRAGSCHFLSEGPRPSDSPTRSLARRFAGALRSRGSLAADRSHTVRPAWA